MFTGIIEEIGSIRDISVLGDSGEITVDAAAVLPGTRLGDSIAVNGVCLTVTRLSERGFKADIMPETVRRTAFSRARIGDRVNLERAMPLNGRFGGHIVAGHIDGTGEIRSLRKQGNSMILSIEASQEVLKYIVEKGSIAIDGVSLTVAGLDSMGFWVGIIPHTGGETTLLSKNSGDLVNLETDIIGKYVERLLQYRSPEESTITLEYLEEMGF
ncbi:MAG: riboflavin synthase [Lachnospiraceae bacterium]|nr:riboflavin synthase [Lachnospiraceae bacterium]